MKTKIRTYGDKVYTNFRGLNQPEYGVETEVFLQSFMLISYLFIKTSIICKYIYATVILNL